MADVELVIKISEEEYRWIKKSDENVFADVASKECMLHAIRNGTPLPKGHGRILDEKDILDTENNGGGWYDLIDMPEYIAGVKEIVGTDDMTESEVQDADSN